MENLRESAAKRVSNHLSGGRFSLPVELIDDEAVLYSVNGSILYDTVGIDPDSGAEILIDNPVVVLSKQDLVRVPQQGEKWVVRIPTEPKVSGIKESFMLSPESPLAGGGSLDYITLFLKKLEQTT